MIVAIYIVLILIALITVVVLSRDCCSDNENLAKEFSDLLSLFTKNSAVVIDKLLEEKQKRLDLQSKVGKLERDFYKFVEDLGYEFVPGQSIPSGYKKADSKSRVSEIYSNKIKKESK